MSFSPYVCFWFNGDAQKAVARYAEIFRDTRIISSNPLVSMAEISTLRFMALNGGPKYEKNSAFSIFYYCESTEEIDRLYPLLMEGGTAVMPLGRYGWADRYAWVVDRFGMHWQLNNDVINNPQKAVPCLLFVHEKRTKLREAIAHYANIFNDHRLLLESLYPEGLGMDPEHLLFGQFKIGKTVINGLSSTEQHDFDFTPGGSFVVECETQEEIDYLWDKLGKDGRYDMCGWLNDRYGVSWQIVPAVLSELMADPGHSQAVIETFLPMQKLEIAPLLRAAGRP